LRSDNRGRGVLVNAMSLGDLDIDDDVFEIVELRTAGSFIAEHAVAGFGRPSLVVGRRRMLSRVFHSRWDDDFLPDLFVHRHDVVPSRAVVKRTDDGGVRAIDGADDSAFGATVRTNGRDFDKHAVTVHGGTDERRRDENVTSELLLEPFVERFRIGQNEAIAIAVHAEAADDHVLAGRDSRQRVAVGVRLDELPSRNEVLKFLVERSTLVAVETEFADELLESGGTLGLAGDELEDGGVGAHRKAASGC